jgi:hypothetical protein
MEKNKIFSTKTKYDGIFSFKDVYKFCYDYLTDELKFNIIETKYSEKLKGNSKDIDVEWEGNIEFDDYFKHYIKVKFKIIGLNEVEIMQEGIKTKRNKGSIEIKMDGIVIRDYRGNYTTNPTRKWMRSIYEKWVIPAKVEKIEDKLIEDCDEFLGQAKAFLDLEGKR